jgi:hypothetical protein
MIATQPLDVSEMIATATTAKTTAVDAALIRTLVVGEFPVQVETGGRL